MRDGAICWRREVRVKIACSRSRAGAASDIADHGENRGVGWRHHSPCSKTAQKTEGLRHLSDTGPKEGSGLYILVLGRNSYRSFFKEPSFTLRGRYR